MNRSVYQIARQQNSLITSAQMVEGGLSMRQVAWGARKGTIERLRIGVYRVSGAPITWVQRAHAAVLAAGPGAVASHLTAAALWRFRHVALDAVPLHITSNRRVRLPGVVGHTGSLRTGDTTTCQQVPVTSAIRTFMDVADSLTLRELGVCLDDAMRRGLINLEQLRRAVSAAAARGGRRQLQPLQLLLAERLPGYRPGANDWERDMDRLWDRLGLEPGVRQYQVHVNGRTYIIDRAIPELKIGAEFNGYEHHHLRSDVDHDARRAAELSAAGWHLIALTSGTRPEIMRAAVSRIVADRQRWLTSARGTSPGG